MSDGKTKLIIILTYQYSVVVKGIERNLQEEGFNTVLVNDTFDQVGGLAPQADLFLFYLPNDIASDVAKIEKFAKVCAKINTYGKNMVILGEKKDRKDIMNGRYGADDFVWLDRPVDIKNLVNEMKVAMARPVVTGDKKRILIIDDDPSYASMVREWIKDTYKTDVVTSGMHAITFLLKNPVNLILLDYEMPVVDGPQVLQMLREEEATSNIPVIFLTGNGTKEAVTRVMELKPEGYVLKSTTREDLLNYLSKKL